jgi:hypothetical protein
MISDHRFDVISVSVPCRETIKFARGHQARVVHEKNEKISIVGKMPESPIDWFKALLVQWDPSLNFGWLAPRIKDVLSITEITEQNTYYNVMPLDKNFQPSYLEVHEWEGLPDLIECDWLLGEPPTQSDVLESCRERLKARELSRYMQHPWYR